MYSLVVIMCQVFNTDGNPAHGAAYRCTQVTIVTGYESIEACDNARQFGKGTHQDAVLYRCVKEGK